MKLTVEQLIDEYENLIEHNPKEWDPEWWEQLCTWARIGAALEALPPNDSIKHVQLIGNEPKEYEWIVSHYQGPAIPYVYKTGLTPLEVLGCLKTT